FYKPKAIVSGDFYWLNIVDNRLVCAVADCTGHGVPGAFMSLLGYNILENVIKKPVMTNPAIVLDDLNTEIINRLSKGQKETVNHGMDISLIFIDKATEMLQFAGAHNPIYIVRQNELIELKADKMGIGFNKEGKNNFSCQQFQLKKGDMIYLFTDGFPDQVGGPKRKKFFYGPFKELLVSINQLDVEMQRNKLDEIHVQWQDNKYEQTDDILIMGIRY
ncbi:MAG TPA: SpoIIE family protein phosphatase, partial [Bacteroidia bacterium]|nr:SpoIIE family protein phosphatase [Bacteroidia bacterium]